MVLVGIEKRRVEKNQERKEKRDSEARIPDVMRVGGGPKRSRECRIRFAINERRIPEFGPRRI